MEPEATATTGAALAAFFGSEELRPIILALAGALIATGVGFLKRAFDSVPRWIVPFIGPVLAPLLVVLADQLTAAQLANPIYVLLAAMMGGQLREMGTWLKRRFVDGHTETVRDANVRKADMPTTSPPTPATP